MVYPTHRNQPCRRAASSRGVCSLISPCVGVSERRRTPHDRWSRPHGHEPAERVFATGGNSSDTPLCCRSTSRPVRVTDGHLLLSWKRRMPALLWT
ncbi:unnamed protein product [Trichogramma brassicae]|uniref:Uncharacterized protein n=1 Tax=Trichogramma brassicae TaxID=86971 RepID=A0A6H5IM05_9HYME|nr:unnamed protein product [Trichogramma brassicae]